MRRVQLLLACSFAATLLAIVFTAVVGRVQHVALHALAAETHTNLCGLETVLRAKAVKDRAGAQAILDANPNGVPGFTKETILAAIADDNALIRKTTDPSCPPPPKEAPP